MLHEAGWERAGVGRVGSWSNSGRLCHYAKYFATEKELKGGSQEIRGGSPKCNLRKRPTFPFSLKKGIWGKSPVILYWWCVTTQKWEVLLIGWQFALTNQKRYLDLGSDRSSVWNFSILLRCHFAGRPVVVSQQCWLFSQATSWNARYRRWEIWVPCPSSPPV